MSKPRPTIRKATARSNASTAPSRAIASAPRCPCRWKTRAGWSPATSAITTRPGYIAPSVTSPPRINSKDAARRSWPPAIASWPRPANVASSCARRHTTTAPPGRAPASTSPLCVPSSPWPKFWPCSATCPRARVARSTVAPVRCTAPGSPRAASASRPILPTISAIASSAASVATPSTCGSPSPARISMTPPWTCASDLADPYQPRSPNAGQREQPVNRGTEKRTRTLGRENCYNVIRGSKHLDQLTQPRFFQIRLNHYSSRQISVAMFLDNLDRRHPAIQEEAYLRASAMARDWSAVVFVSLRPTTFYYSQKFGVLDSVAPRLINVVSPKTEYL